MGLSAVVLHPSAEGSIEPDLILAEARLGNATMIGHLSERASLSLPRTSLLISRILYSGSHSGDELEPELLSAVHDEIAILMKDDDADVQSFCTNMTKLLDAASEHEVPILFV